MTTPIRIGIISSSDRASRGEREDQSGQLLKRRLETWGGEVIAYRVLPDERGVLEWALCHLADQLHCDLVLTTGGTGLGPRDVMPEATREIIQKEIPGIAEALREAGRKKIKTAILSRGLAGLRDQTLIINLPGSPEAVGEALEILAPVLFHAVELIRGEVHDCQKVREEKWKGHFPPLSHSLP